ncbi:adenosylcobinamide-GDP ribazoletransferase [Jeotgalibacillus proteolyticus]|uniref:Adenosylcobinamide-GDP ribazoletransferase n=1 Tax=Jeotgalibacillus proteolyticus TaxID=2082395 RepID=A0A2S5G9I4_9BACL|nr:adenosylcobinamide-GDP ribazoletransferase [Jeotgalibacillus proteolyticus]PPA69662.1 adenosylcobinamide-GDP ribazoletransferase [Jeotgalibacillus proteolyticus]
MKKNIFKDSIHGLMLAFQFFTVLPIKKEIKMNSRTMFWMTGSLPVAGLVIGSSILAAVHGIELLFSPTPFILALVIWLGFIVWTGGLHLDGWTDASDAFFSYGDHKKRHTVLKDPRTGALGVLSLIVLLGIKGVLLADISWRFGLPGVWLIWIPILSRLMMMLYLIKAPLAKKEGIAYYMRNLLSGNVIYFPAVVTVILLLLTPLMMPVDWQLLFVLLSGWIVFYIGFKRFAEKEFGGMNGDLLGAGLEGGEGWSLILVWCYLSIAMG